MSGGLFSYAGLWLRAAPCSLLCVRRPTLIIPHDTNAADKIQHPIHVKERCTLPTLHVLNATAPARPSSRPLLPEADDEGADGGNWG